MTKAAVRRAPAAADLRRDDAGLRAQHEPDDHQHELTHPAHPVHWAPPDIAGDILAIACRTGAAAPREIRVRPELRDRMLAQMSPTDRRLVEQHGTIGGAAGVPLVVDEDLPLFPGFEIVRARPGSHRMTHAA